MQAKEKAKDSPKVVQVEAYYTTRQAAQSQSELYFEATIFLNLESVSALSKLGLYEKAAAIEVPEGIETNKALDIAYEKTQNIHDSWTDNEGVTAFTQTPRSSMPGDVFVIKGQAYAVVNFGFMPLESFEKPVEAKKKSERNREDDGPSF